MRNRYARALEIAKKIENEDKRSSTVAFLNYEWGKLSSDKGDWNDARRRFESVRTRYEGEIAYASLLRYLGLIAFKQGRIYEARSLYQESLTRSQQMRIQNKIALAKLGLANVEESEGNLSVALDLAKSANDIFGRLGAQEQAQDAQELVERLERSCGKCDEQGELSGGGKARSRGGAEGTEGAEGNSA